MPTFAAGVFHASHFCFPFFSYYRHLTPSLYTLNGEAKIYFSKFCKVLCCKHLRLRMIYVAFSPPFRIPKRSETCGVWPKFICSKELWRSTYRGWFRRNSYLVGRRLHKVLLHHILCQFQNASEKTTSQFYRSGGVYFRGATPPPTRGGGPSPLF